MDTKIEEIELERLIVEEFPYPIAVNYHRLQELTNWKDKTDHVIHIFDFLLRTLCLALISQYLIVDRDISDSYLNQLLNDNLPAPTLGKLNEIFFTTLRLYNKYPKKRLFIPELYSFFDEKSPQKLKKGVREPFDKFVRIRNHGIVHGLPPMEDIKWVTIYQELYGYLLQIFNELRFISNYDLIHITRQEGNAHYYQRYRGQQVVEIDEPIRSDESLGDDWFYLAKGKPRDFKLLKLYPFLIAWDKDTDLNLPGMQSDAALLHNFSDTTIEYMATVLWETFLIETESFLADFYYSFERPLRMKQREGRGHDPREGQTHITWDSMRQAAIALSIQQVGAARAKYEKALYLQRKDALSKFEDFLSSDKRCFVLTGKSGVGKSNFVFSLKDEFSKKGDNTCFLIYNAARLSTSENISQMISQDFGRYLLLGSLENKDLFKTLEDSGEMEDKLLVVVFDAINENIEGKSLLRNIDHMIGESDYRWLKVVITSRPESWKTLKRGVPLAEALYYREREQEELGVELPEFTIQLDQFHREELPLVYGLYRKKYHLETSYEELTAAIRSSLRDPLILRLVAEIYGGTKIPGMLRVMDIYDQYIQALLKSERLFEQDLRLLEQEIMPLMITDEPYSNRLSSSQIEAAQTKDGRPLWELVSNDDLLSNGHPVNESFQRLVNAEILLKLGSSRDSGIGFKYERFYDYFASGRLQAVLDKGSGGVKGYQKLLLDLSQYPFLWGATLRILTSKMIPDQELLLALAYQKDQTSQKMVIEVLSEYGKQGDKVGMDVQELLSMLMSNKTPKQLRGQMLDKADHNAAKVVAVEVAAQIGAPEILVRACDDTSTQVRSLSVQRIADLWRSDLEAGKKTLSLLTDKSAHRILWVPIPNRRVLESAVGAAALIFAENYSNGAAVQPLREVFLRKLFKTLLPLSVENPFGRMFNLLAYLLLSNIVISLVSSIPSKRSQSVPANFTEISEYFHLPREKRNLMLELLPAFYPENGPLNQYRDVLKRAAAVADGDLNWVIFEILAKRGIIEPFEAADIIHELFDLELDRERPTYLALLVIYSFGEFLSRMDSNSKDCLNLDKNYQELVKRFMQETGGRIYYRNPYISDSLTCYLDASYRLFRKANYEMVHTILLDVCQREDWEMLGAITTGFQTTKYPYSILYSLEPLLMDDREPVVLALMNIISQLLFRFPDEVIDFLDNHKYSQQLKDSLATLNQTWEIIDQLAVGMSGFLVDATMSPSLQDAMVLLLGQMPHCRNIKQWLSILVAYLANISYQDTLFKVKMWPVDVGHKIIKNPFE